jgi:hypothetical protein
VKQKLSFNIESSIEMNNFKLKLKNKYNKNVRTKNANEKLLKNVKFTEEIKKFVNTKPVNNLSFIFGDECGFGEFLNCSPMRGEP